MKASDTLSFKNIFILQDYRYRFSFKSLCVPYVCFNFESIKKKKNCVKCYSIIKRETTLYIRFFLYL